MDQCVDIRCFNNREHNNKPFCHLLLCGIQKKNDHTVIIYNKCSKCNILWQTEYDIASDTILNTQCTGSIKDNLQFEDVAQLID